MDRETDAAAIAPLNRGEQFLREEDGTILFFAAVMMILMLMLAGMGVDIMRFETTRTELQQTLDRATLASASMTQELDPEDVVRDYVAKAGLTDKLTTVEVTEGLNFRNVLAEAAADTNPIFMDLYNPNEVFEMEARGRSVAEQRITNVEISLVLDVSGSMASNSRLVNLKTAANEFIDTVLESDDDNRISIGIVPFNGQVNLPEVLQQQFNEIDDHGVTDVNCYDLPASVYGSSGMSTTLAMPVTAHADTFSSTSTSGYLAFNNSSATPNPANRWCPPSTVNTVLPPTNNAVRLHNKITNLTAVGATSINAGLKWGLALIDPSSRGIISNMVTAGLTPGHFNGRPFDYGDDEAMKIVVLMTDGEHFAEERVNPGFRTGQAPIWRANGDTNYSIFHASRVTSTSATTICNSRPFWVPHLGAWHSRPWNGTAPGGSACYSATATYTGVTRQTWQQVWANQRMTWVAWQLYARAFGSSTSVYTSTMDQMRTKTPIGSMDAQLQEICGLARGNNVIVYGISFEAPANGATQIEQCSSSRGHYFDANGLEIQSAFRSIASNISQLRLTQ